MNWDVQLRLASLRSDVRSDVVWSFVVVWDPFGLMLALMGWSVQSELECSLMTSNRDDVKPDQELFRILWSG